MVTTWTRTTLTPADWLIDAAEPDDPAIAARVGHALEHGPGFTVVRGLPVADHGDPIPRRFARLLGVPRPEPTGLVTDLSGRGEPRRGMDTGPLALHTDRAGPPRPPRLLALRCVRAAAAGGDSVLANGHTVHARLRTSHPGLVEELYQDFHFGTGRVYPVFTRDRRVHYNRHWIERGNQATGRPFSARTRAALDAFDAALADPGLTVELRLRPGDLLILDNTSILHGRTAFTDDPDNPRCLLRQWLD
ncbi:TauD/TfdA family dioxygenase [Nonomuraea sp. NN258]|uniref:TauD/TfdA family dioxygenase n=1 Tax=Nonomuraea antri TaxID=2730852 RepID=UPI0015694425|nr:TauD/TfdA family dioxygenase [Nonomuraea antri]NRQ32849.1 TauD/TfdA family dioxygenase [Nonomuraea antri]